MELLRKRAELLKGPPRGERANLEGADLRGAKIRGVKLKGAKLKGTRKYS